MGVFACALIAAIAFTLLSAADAPAKNNGGVKAEETCPPFPNGLSPKGAAANRFTMLIRINQQVNADTWNNFDEKTDGLGGRVLPQDIFVVNTRFDGSSPELAAQIATSLRAAHPCNRIIALNGLGLNPAVAGYAFTLLDHPSVWGLMSDFETDDWNRGAASDPGRPPWSYSYRLAYKRIKRWDGRMAAAGAKSSTGAAKRTGLVPLDVSGWNYGQIAQDLDKKNRRLGGRHLGPLSVQTQDSCANGGASAFNARAGAVFDQYRYKYVTKVIRVKKKGKVKRKRITVRRKLKKQARPDLNNLAMQISFSNTPDSRSSMAITKTSAKTAANCARAALKRGGGAFFFFASPDSMRLLFKQGEIGSLRPSPTAKK